MYDQPEVIADRHAAEFSAVLVRLDRLDAWLGGAHGSPIPMPPPLRVTSRDVNGLEEIIPAVVLNQVLEVLTADADEMALVRSRLDSIVAKLRTIDPTPTGD